MLNAVRLSLTFCLCTSFVHATSTTDQVLVGGPGATSAHNSTNPPTLDDGTTLASATLDYSFDDVMSILSITVTNTSPNHPTNPNPIITDVYFNLPHLAVQGAVLLSQSGSGGATPAFNLSLDLDNQVAPNPISVLTFGDFGGRLSIGSTVLGAIANAGANRIDAPAGSWVVGPVTFEIQIVTGHPQGLTASAFARSVSQNGTKLVTGTCRFDRGGLFGDAQGFLGDGPDCIAAGWVAGQPCLGNTIELVMSGNPGCHGCLATSPNLGPLNLGFVVSPIGDPMWPVVVATAPPVSTLVTPVPIPNRPALVNMTAYFAVFMVDQTNALSSIRVSDAFSVTICP